MASAAYERRNAAARAKGYESYYDYRAHGNGSRPPAATRLKGEALRVARGHAGRADLAREMRPGTLITATPDPTSRKKDGTYSRVYITAIFEDGTEREYTLKPGKMKPGEYDKLISDLTQAGGVFSPSPSLNIEDAGGEDDDPNDDPDELDFYDPDDDGIPF